ncbi:HalOD1 output domain-containing protein [Haladaptatus halobius]|uniref:HalOD1 output domain-containing protein n=1 Tax=Haladaptatus halobius TaxID=2884875 RepID=UPI001D0B07A8|nr:HalOD1 output domain-containing protein [Haladaptatus halobius]
MTAPTTTPASTRRHDASQQSVTEQIVAAIADAADTSHRELPPLYEVIDPDALNRLFTPTYEGDTRSDGRVRFAYAGYEVVVHSMSGVEVSPVSTSGEQHHE